MKYPAMFVSSFLPVLICLQAAAAAKILGLLPFYGTSHNLVTMPLFEELAHRGHDVTVAGYFEPKRPSPNFKSILLKRDPGKPLRGFLSQDSFYNADHMTTVYLVDDLLQDNDDAIQRNKDKYDQIFEGTYDLVIMEFFESGLFTSYVEKLGIPFILFHTSETIPWHRQILREPISPSLIPHSFSKYASGMNFKERLWNTVEVVQMLAYYKLRILPNAQRIADKYLGPLPPVDNIAKNASLYFSNTHSSLFGPRLMTPATIEVGGLNVVPPKALEKVCKAQFA